MYAVWVCVRGRTGVAHIHGAGTWQTAGWVGAGVEDWSACACWCTHSYVYLCACLYTVSRGRSPFVPGQAQLCTQLELPVVSRHSNRASSVALCVLAAPIHGVGVADGEAATWWLVAVWHRNSNRRIPPILWRFPAARSTCCLLPVR